MLKCLWNRELMVWETVLDSYLSTVMSKGTGRRKHSLKF